MPNLYVRQTALSNAGGRINYISSPEKQENLLAFHDGAADVTDGAYWSLLAQECREAQKHSSPGTKMCQARELVIQLSNALLQRMPPEQIAKTLADEFQKTYHRPCAVGVHFNVKKNNLHAHLIYSERTLLPSPEKKVAPRALFFDEQGKRCYKKSEVLGDDGQLRPGCRIVKKGDVYDTRYFGPVDSQFSSRAWLRDCKTSWVLPLRNGALRGDVEITEFSGRGGKLPQQHVGNKARPEVASRVRAYNTLVKQWNALIDMKGVPPALRMSLRNGLRVPFKNDRLGELIRHVEKNFRAMGWGLPKPKMPAVAPAAVRSADAEHRQPVKEPVSDRPAAQTVAASQKREPSPVPSFAALITADEGLQKAKEVVRQAEKKLDGPERPVNQQLLDLPEKLRTAVEELTTAQATVASAEQELQLLSLRHPSAPRGPFVSQKKKQQYEADREAYWAKTEQVKASLSEGKAAITAQLAIILPHLQPEQRQRQGRGNDAPVVTAENINRNDVNSLARFVDWELSRHNSELRYKVKREQEYADKLDTLNAAREALKGSQERFDGLMREIPPEHQEKALQAISEAREQRQAQQAAVRSADAERRQPASRHKPKER